MMTECVIHFLQLKDLYPKHLASNYVQKPSLYNTPALFVVHVDQVGDEGELWVFVVRETITLLFFPMPPVQISMQVCPCHH